MTVARVITDFERTPFGRLARQWNAAMEGLTRWPGMSDAEWHRRVLWRIDRAVEQERETHDRNGC
jgi:hypothetical protein